MKTSYAKYILITLAFVSMFFYGEANAQVKIGFVDSETILKQLPEAQAVQSELEGLQKQYLDTIQTKENDLKSKAEIFKTQYDDAQKKVESGQITSEAEMKELQNTIGELQNEIQTLSESFESYKQTVQNNLLQKQAELFKPVKDKITKTIEQVAKSMKINFVFDKADGTMLYGDKEFDITFKVLDKLK
ncbi:MAG TPA: OmpH family outer membrane protein [Ignavibacteria bacterium]|nr:OmpH family outer membrane protein [Ignavibacteria bacterium]HMR40964.1 OmpH family outer membrane protein [Ignavibacteria bacterium]